MKKYEGYRIINRGDEYVLVLLISHSNFVEVNKTIIIKKSFEELRSEVNKMVEAFGKEVIKLDMEEINVE